MSLALGMAATLLPCAVRGQNPTLHAVTSTMTQIVLRWDDPFTDSVGYELQRAVAFDQFQTASSTELPMEDMFWDRLTVNPYTIAIFAQNRIQYDKFVINVGLRYDYFNPNIIYPEKSVVSLQDTLRLDNKPGKQQFQISPRAGVSFPFLLDNDRIHLNYGWFFQTPPLYYFYLNSQQNLNLNFPIVGNPQLEAERAEAFEIGYQKALDSKTVLGATYFTKKIENLVNTKIYYSGEDHQSNYTQFENLDRASIKGLEIFIEKRPDSENNLFGKLSYSYCKAIGTGSFPLQNYYTFLQDPVYHHGLKQYPLAWDQRHKISGNLSYVSPAGFEINIFTRLNSPLPKLDQQFRVTWRGLWRRYVDLRLLKSFNWLKGEFSPYLEVLNLLNDR